MARELTRVATTETEHSHGITPDTIRSHWEGDRLDLDLALTALLHLEAHRCTTGAA